MSKIENLASKDDKYDDIKQRQDQLNKNYSQISKIISNLKILFLNDINRINDFYKSIDKIFREVEELDKQSSINEKDFNDQLILNKQNNDSNDIINNNLEKNQSLEGPLQQYTYSKIENIENLKEDIHEKTKFKPNYQYLNINYKKSGHTSQNNINNQKNDYILNNIRQSQINDQIALKDSCVEYPNIGKNQINSDYKLTENDKENQKVDEKEIVNSYVLINNNLGFDKVNLNSNSKMEKLQKDDVTESINILNINNNTSKNNETKNSSETDSNNSQIEDFSKEIGDVSMKYASKLFCKTRHDSVRPDILIEPNESIIYKSKVDYGNKIIDKKFSKSSTHEFNKMSINSGKKRTTFDKNELLNANLTKVLTKQLQTKNNEIDSFNQQMNSTSRQIEQLRQKNSYTKPVFEQDNWENEINNTLNLSQLKKSDKGVKRYDSEGKNTQVNLSQYRKSEKVKMTQKRNVRRKNSFMKNQSTVDSNLKKLIQEIDSYPLGALIIDEKQDIRHVNQNLLDLLFYDEKSLYDTNFINFLSEKSQFYFKQEIISNLSSGESSVNGVELQVFDKNMNVVELICNVRSIKIEENNETIFIINLTEMDLGPENCQAINPQSQSQLCWTLVLLLAIFFLLVQTPQDIAFGVEENNQSWKIDWVITSIFATDIVLNFFIGFEDSEGKMCQDSWAMFKNYFQSWFWFDIVATFPFDEIWKDMVINTQLIRSIKIIRLFKLLKMARLAKIQSFLNFNQFFETEFGRDVYQQFKRNKSQYDLLLNNVQILFGAHQFAIMFYQCKTQLIENGTNEWALQKFIELENEDNNFRIQCQLVFLFIKTSLGLFVYDSAEYLEMFIITIWMFVGLAIFGQGIGNISSYLNQANKKDIEYAQCLTYFNEIYNNNQLDPRVQEMIMSDIENQFEKFTHKELSDQSHVLSKNVKNQLEYHILRDFINSFPLFGALNLGSIRKLKNKCKVDNKRVVLRKGIELSAIYFVLVGKISIQDDEMQLVNDQRAGEIFGMSHFKDYAHTHLNLDLWEMDKADDTLSLQQFQNNLRTEEMKHKIQMLASDNEIRLDKCIQVLFKYKAISSQDVKQLELNQDDLVDLMCNDFYSFHEIQTHSMDQQKLLTIEEKKESRNNIDMFNSNNRPALMYFEDGTIAQVNTKLQFNNVIFMQLIGSNVKDCLEQQFNDFEEDQECVIKSGGEQVAIINGQNWYFKVDNHETMRVTKSDLNHLNSDDNLVYNYKKSMIEVNIIQVSNIEELKE